MASLCFHRFTINCAFSKQKRNKFEQCLNSVILKINIFFLNLNSMQGAQSIYFDTLSFLFVLLFYMFYYKEYNVKPS